MGRKLKIGSSYVSTGPNEELEEILSLLESYQSLPNYTVDSRVPIGEYSPSKNTIRLNPYRGGTVDTISHESTHALEELMKRLAAEDAKLGGTQFSNGLASLFTPTKLPGVPKNPTGYDKYRYSPTEMRAFGVGNMVSDGQTKPIANHLDTTMAQEQAILRELLKRRKK